MDNCTHTLGQLLGELHIPHSKRFVADSVQSHPEHPSLLSITDSLDKYHIENMAVKITEDKLSQMPLPAIVQLSDTGGMFHVLSSFTTDKVVLKDDKGKRETLDQEAFLKRWTGVCLLVEPQDHSKEPNIAVYLKKQRFQWALVALLGLGLLLWGLPTLIHWLRFQFDTSVFLFALVKCIGLVVGLLLLLYEADKSNPSLQAFCSGGGKTNCDAVLQSKGAKLIQGEVSLSILGFSYFFSTSILLFAYGQNALGLLGVLSLINIPVVLGSAYYQGYVLKQWCPFCLLVQGALFFEIGISLFYGFTVNTFSIAYIPALLSLFVLPVWLWKNLKPLLDRQKETLFYKRGLSKIKNNPSVLEGLLQHTRKISTPTQGLGISFTNPKAQYDVIKVCNPYCGPCAKAHPILDELVEREKINLQVLFTASTAKNDIKTKPVGHFLAIDGKGNKEQTLKALDDWYMADKKDYDTYAQKYPINGELVKQHKKIEAMRQWCDTEKITHTPTLFINGNELPKEYSVEDLKEVLR
jgi:thiol-disulfide isomerase/thioredoxin